MTPAYRPGRRPRPLRLGPSAPEARGQTHRSLQAPSHASPTPRASVGTEPAPPWDPTFSLSADWGCLPGTRSGRERGGQWHVQSWLSACAVLHARGLSGAGTRACAGGQARGLRVLCPMPPSPQNVRWELFEARRAPLGLTRGKWGGRQLPMLGEGGEGHRTPSMVTSEEAES